MGQPRRLHRRAAHLFGAIFAALTSRGAAELIGFGNTNIKLIHDQSLKVETALAGLYSVQKFYFVPDGKAEPAMITTDPRGKVKYYPDGLLTTNVNDAKNKQILDIDNEHVQWAGMHSVAFDPDWPAQPFLYVLYTGYTQINQNAGETYPNKLNRPRPYAWNGANQCKAVDGGSNFNSCYKSRTECPDLAQCPALSLYCELMSHVDRIQYNPTTMTMVNRTPIYKGGCTGYWGHVFGNVVFNSQKQMLIMTGDKAIDWVPVDAGCETADMCFDTNAGLPQGQWNSLRDHSDNGKLIRIPNPARYRTAGGLLTKGTDYTIITRGLRNPYSAFMDLRTDQVLVGDTGDANAERIHQIATTGNNPIYNLGWPCIDGNFPLNDVDKGVIIQTNGETRRAAYLKARGLTTCDSTYKAAGRDALTHIVGNAANTQADPGYILSVFEYRNRPDKTIDGCANARAAISGVAKNYNTRVGAYYTNGVFFADHSKECLFFIPALADGKLDVANPRAVLSGIPISWVTVHPTDGSLLVMNFNGENVNSSIVKLYGSTRAAAGGTGGVIEPPPPPLPVGIPAPPANTLPVTTFGANGICQPELKPFVWTADGTGALTGTIKIGAVQYTNKYGQTRTRAYNGGLPGPTLVMEACKRYKLTLVNEMQSWPNPSSGNINGYHSPSSTNLHTHGLHISGGGVADNVGINVEPGKTFTHTYSIPCDHAGGTYFYHAHKHGSVALQAGGGAVGLLIIEDNQKNEIDRQPAQFKSMPAKEFIIQRMTPAETRGAAADSGDALYKSTAQENHYLTNGCTDIKSQINAQQWTRLRFVYLGGQSSGVLTIKAGAAGVCIARLLAKDGVYLNTVPRDLPEPKLLFAFGSRVDVAVWCPPGTHEMTMNLLVDEDNAAIATKTVGSIVAVTNAAASGPYTELAKWTPCRSFGLSDLTQRGAPTTANFMVSFNEGTINSQPFEGEDSSITTVQEGSWYQWSYVNTDVHPGHMHINHVQLHEFFPRPEVPGWHQKGDWLDSISLPGSVSVRFWVDRYGGKALIHCHVSEHADGGMAAMIKIDGGSVAGDEKMDILKPGTCPGAAPTEPTGPVIGNSDPTCANGIKHPSQPACCPTECWNAATNQSTCGTAECAGVNNSMADKCCYSKISVANRPCNTFAAPCYPFTTGVVVTPPTDPVIGDSDPTCANGIKHPSQPACCPKECWNAATNQSTCGTAECAGVNNSMADKCCYSKISTANRPCNAFTSPCYPFTTGVVVTPPTDPITVTADPTCAKGLKHIDLSKKACCPTECWNAATNKSTCGTAECAGVNNSMADKCCYSKISVANRPCNTFAAPCYPYSAGRRMDERMVDENGDVFEAVTEHEVPSKDELGSSEHVVNVEVTADGSYNMF